MEEEEASAAAAAAVSPEPLLRRARPAPAQSRASRLAAILGRVAGGTGTGRDGTGTGTGTAWPIRAGAGDRGAPAPGAGPTRAPSWHSTSPGTSPSPPCPRRCSPPRPRSGPTPRLGFGSRGTGSSASSMWASCGPSIGGGGLRGGIAGWRKANTAAAVEVVVVGRGRRQSRRRGPIARRMGMRLMGSRETVLPNDVNPLIRWFPSSGGSLAFIGWFLVAKHSCKMRQSCTG
ncbi:hypothetical protein ACMD2_03473 [Ananas comosus]|uniref:Uncharacterized protein n=1 Tax=Ananas comosus TaxID=4615 RepID=A0A199VID5_ANACO|nr:hypothetical protein ACMD2_03473 [Ananas comosus]